MRTKDVTTAVEELPVGAPQDAAEDVAAMVWDAAGAETQPPASEADAVPVATASPAADADADIPMATVDGEQKHSAWRLFTSEDLPQLSLREILGGDYLITSFLRENIIFILFLVALGVGYITNRYLAQQEVIEEARLRKELVDMKYFALTQGAQLTMRSRQSNIERQLVENGDDQLKAAITPPFIIRPQ